MLNATVAKKTVLTHELILLYIKPDLLIPDFIPGQYVALGLYGSAPRDPNHPFENELLDPKKLVKRAYSIGSSPQQKDYLEFYFSVVPQGCLTPRLDLLNEGDRLYVAPKITGTFTLCDIAEDCNLIFVATGTGIAPFMSMLRTPSTWKNRRKIVLVHGVRYASDLAYRDELLELAGQDPGLFYIPIISREDHSWNGARGHVQKVFLEDILELNPAEDHVFLCGNPGMIDDMEKILADRKYTVHTKKKPGNLHLERYW